MSISSSLAIKIASGTLGAGTISIGGYGIYEYTKPLGKEEIKQYLRDTKSKDLLEFEEAKEGTHTQQTDWEKIIEDNKEEERLTNIKKFVKEIDGWEESTSGTYKQKNSKLLRQACKLEVEKTIFKPNWEALVNYCSKDKSN